MTPSAASATAAPAIAPRRTTSPRRAPVAPRRPRRVSGPAHPANPARNPSRAQSRAWAGPAHALGLAEAVATHRLLDRLIRGRVWIGVIAFALIGIVTMQLVLLKLNAGIGRSLVRETLLQRENAALSAENSEVAAGEQIEAQAEHAGMELIPEGVLRFLTAHPASDVSKAAAALSAPIAATSTGGEATASNTSTTGEATAPSTASAGEVATSDTSTGEASTPAAAATTEVAATPSPATTSETPASSASTATPAVTSAGGASEAAGASTPAGQSTSIATGGGTPGG
jgi:hypothetical protein